MWTWNSAPCFVYLFLFSSCFSSSHCSLPSLPNARNSYSLSVALVVLTLVKPFKCVPFTQTIFFATQIKKVHIIAFTYKSLLVSSFDVHLHILPSQKKNEICFV
ncbi:hypothetical protein PHAVU_005G070600 [Phaseolus vulgaris]|uniref:Secreted protein n=1 Tax=Phaseolus vulgaris TaxID=3885 RepID=V7BWL3_PHAVU|nr:hypothetical protein PHAVU_005G070600g [Phaseolus vulgaris]ESW21435.1 hypothetical protein PHAVU_005G070600g [Phaseolus vulgaris]